MSDRRRKLNPCDSSNLQSPVRIKMSPGYHRSLSLSHELKSLRDQIFNAIPQNPHFRPLANYCNPVREGLKLGLDVVFINLAQKINNLVDPLELLADVDDYIAQLSELEEMGYDVSKIWDRFDTLRRIAQQEKATREELEEVEMKLEDTVAKMKLTDSRVPELEMEIVELKAALTAKKSEMEGLDWNMMKLKEEEKNNCVGFLSTAQAPF